MCRMHGCTYEELLNLPLNALIHPDYLPLFREYIQRSKRVGSSKPGQLTYAKMARHTQSR